MGELSFELQFGITAYKPAFLMDARIRGFAARMAFFYHLQLKPTGFTYINLVFLHLVTIRHITLPLPIIKVKT